MPLSGGKDTGNLPLTEECLNRTTVLESRGPAMVSACTAWPAWAAAAGATATRTDTATRRHSPQHHRQQGARVRQLL